MWQIYTILLLRYFYLFKNKIKKKTESANEELKIEEEREDVTKCIGHGAPST